VALEPGGPCSRDAKTVLQKTWAPSGAKSLHMRRPQLGLRDSRRGSKTHRLAVSPTKNLHDSDTGLDGIG